MIANPATNVMAISLCKIFIAQTPSPFMDVNFLRKARETHCIIKMLLEKDADVLFFCLYKFMQDK
jgi:hypothetical protein